MDTTSRYYTLSREDGKLVIRIQDPEIAQGDIERLLDLIVFESIRRKSQITQEQVDELAAEVDQAVWAKLSAKYGQ